MKKDKKESEITDLKYSMANDINDMEEEFEIFELKSQEEMDKIQEEQRKEFKKNYKPLSEEKLEKLRKSIEERKYTEGLTIEEFKELLEYIEKHNSRKYLQYNHEKVLKDKKELLIWINYVESSMDTRDCMIWRVRFIIVNNTKREIVFRTENGYNMKKEIYKFLNKTEQEVLEMNLKIVD